MTDTSNPVAAAEGLDISPASPKQLAELAIARDKREGLDLAVKARWVALAIIAVLIPFVNTDGQVIYYEILLLGFALIGWAQKRVGRAGRSRTELFLMFCDLALLTFVCLVPNPFSTSDFPLALQYRFDNFIYFFVLLAGATLAYSWRTVIAMGTWTAAMWSAGVAYIWYFSRDYPDLSDAATAAFANRGSLAEFFDPNNILLGMRAQEIIVFLIVAVTLAITVRRGNKLLVDHVEIERERANLARYFSPNLVEELAHKDDPFKQVRTQDIAVLFVDIVGFTRYSANRPPVEVIETLRGFHGRMEGEVFRHQGTLDKYLGDGLMATFGTPAIGKTDALDALKCARAMVLSLEAWNRERVIAGEPVIRAGFGLHYGPAVLGDIGTNRLEFATIGNTVNIASRLEALTRDLETNIVASKALMDQAEKDLSAGSIATEGFRKKTKQKIRGLAKPMTVWVLD